MVGRAQLARRCRRRRPAAREWFVAWDGGGLTAEDAGRQDVAGRQARSPGGGRAPGGEGTELKRLGEFEVIHDADRPAPVVI